MGRNPCCSKAGLNRGTWTAQEDKILLQFINVHGQGKWNTLPQRAGLKRCGKSCRLRWLNYLRPDIKRGNISPDEEDLIIRLHKLLGNRWSLIAGRLPGRTDNEIKNYWNTNLCKKVKEGYFSSIWTEKNYTQKTKPQCPSLSSSPNESKLDSFVVRPKASKFPKFLSVDTVPLTSMQVHSMSNMAELEAEAEAETLVVDDAANNSTGVYDDGVLSFPSYEKELSKDLHLDFDIGGIFLPDLLNSDFSDICDFSYNNNNHEDLLPFSDQPLVSSHEILHDNDTEILWR